MGQEKRFLKTVSHYHKRYSKKLIGLGFHRKDNGYWRIYGDNHFQILTFSKNWNEEDVQIEWILCPLYVPILIDDFSKVKLEELGLTGVDIRKYYESTYENREDSGYIDDAVIEFALQLFQQADTAEHAYQIMKKMYHYGDTSGDEYDTDTWLYWPECKNLQMAYLALRYGNFEQCQEYANFKYAYNLMMVRNNMFHEVYPTEHEYQIQIGTCDKESGELWELLHLVYQDKQFILEKIFQENIEENMRYINNQGMVKYESLTGDYSKYYEKKLQKLGFSRQGNAYWRMYGEDEFQVLVFGGTTVTEESSFLQIATYPLYCSGFLQEMMEINKKFFLSESGMWDMESAYIDFYGQSGKKDEIVDYAISCLQQADTAEHAYALWKKFQHFRRSPLLKCEASWPECIASPMFYYAVRCGAYKAAKAYDDFVQANLLLLRKEIEENQIRLENTWGYDDFLEKMDQERIEKFQNKNKEEHQIVEWMTQNRTDRIHDRLCENIRKNKSRLKKFVYETN